LRSYNISVLNGSEHIYFPGGIAFCRALEQVGGHKVSLVNYGEIYNQHGPKKAINIINDELRKNNAEIVFIALDVNFYFPIEFFSDLRKWCFVVMEIGDDEHFFDKNHRYYSQGFDLVWTSSQPSVLRYGLYGIDAIFTPPLCDLQGEEKLSCEKIYDVCFVGIVSGKIGRSEYLRHLLNNNINVEIFGGGTRGGRLSKDEMKRVYNSSKIGLSFTGLATNSGLDLDLSINRRIKQIKGRSHEIALTGTFVLSEYAPGIEDNFKIGDEIDVFRDESELLSKIKYYLNNDTVREEMALKAYNRALNDCDEVKVWAKLMEIFDAKIEIKNKNFDPSSITIYKDPIFKRTFSSFHLSKMIEFLLRGKPKAAWHEFLVYVKYPFIDGGAFFWFVNRYVTRFLVNIKGLRSFVRKVKMFTMKDQADKV
jgi:hypothetical protein